MSNPSSGSLEFSPPGLRLPLILSQLNQAYGRPVHARGEDPLDTLIATVLSQNTSDVNSHRAFAQLKERFFSWEEVLTARSAQIARAIRRGGLADIKASRIKRILGRIKQEQGRLALTSLQHKSVQEIRNYLVSLPGVGPKTAACVMLFSMKKPAFPVDTHVLRVSKRLGLIPPKTTMDRAHELFERLLIIDTDTKWKAKEMLELHLGLVRHGRRICIARRPKCDICSIFELCPRLGLSLPIRPAT